MRDLFILIWELYISGKYFSQKKIVKFAMLIIFLYGTFYYFLLPPKTIIGPITGGSLFNRKSLINYLLRNYVLNLFNFISYLIIKIRIKKLLFSTDLLKKFFNTNDNYYYNYVLKDLNIKNIKSKKI